MTRKNELTLKNHNPSMKSNISKKSKCKGVNEQHPNKGVTSHNVHKRGIIT